MTTYRIMPDNLTDPRVLDLLRLHLDEMCSWSPPESVHALPPEKLRADDVSFFAAWDDAQLAAVGALKHLDERRGELKSMRAAPEYRGKGAGQAILRHLLSEAQTRGYRWLGLETGRCFGHGAQRQIGGNLVPPGAMGQVPIMQADFRRRMHLPAGLQAQIVHQMKRLRLRSQSEDEVITAGDFSQQTAPPVVPASPPARQTG